MVGQHRLNLSRVQSTDQLSSGAKGGVIGSEEGDTSSGTIVK